jgi:hypothetical protein
MRSKYHNRKVIVDGLKFDSIKEAKRWRELCLLYRAGEIGEVERQVEFVLIPTQRTRTTDGKTKTERAVKYRADFVYLDKNGRQVVEDVKGVRTKEYILKRKMMLFFRGIAIREV